MSEDRIDPFWEFYYETGIDPTGGELDTDNAPNFKKVWNKIRNRIRNK